MKSCHNIFILNIDDFTDFSGRFIFSSISNDDVSVLQKCTFEIVFASPGYKRKFIVLNV